MRSPPKRSICGHHPSAPFDRCHSVPLPLAEDTFPFGGQDPMPARCASTAYIKRLFEPCPNAVWSPPLSSLWTTSVVCAMPKHPKDFTLEIDRVLHLLNRFYDYSPFGLEHALGGAINELILALRRGHGPLAQKEFISLFPQYALYYSHDRQGPDYQNRSTGTNIASLAHPDRII
jgi:hypothetical protein